MGDNGADHWTPISKASLMKMKKSEMADQINFDDEHICKMADDQILLAYHHEKEINKFKTEITKLKNEIKQWAKLAEDRKIRMEKLAEDRKIRMEKLRHYMMEFDLWHAFEDGLPDTRNADDCVRLVRGLDLDNDTPGGRRVIMRARMSATDSDSDSD